MAAKKRTTLLLVDDRADNLFTLREVITDLILEECDILTASSAEEGLAIASKTLLDGALIDVQMRPIDGIEMCRRLHADPATADVPVILMTAHRVDAALKARGLKVGAIDFIHKPIDNVELIARIGVMLRIKQTTDARLDANAQLEHRVKERTEELRRYEHIVSCSGDMLALLSENFVYLAANEAYLQPFGKTSDDVIGRTVAEVFGQDVFDTVIKPKAELCLNGQDVRYQDWFDFPVTGRKYMDIAYSPYLGPDGQVRGFVVTGRDITKQKQAEQAVQDARDMLREQVDTRTAQLSQAVKLLEAMLANIHVCVAYLDTNFNFIRVNEAYAVPGGHRPDYYIGKNHFDIYPHAENEAVFKRAVQTGQPVMFDEQPFEFPDRRELGVTYWDWTLRPLKNSQGKVVGLLLSMLDATTRVRARNQIEAERKKLFSVLNMLPGYAVIKSPDYRLRFSSHGYLETFGEPAGRPCHEIQFGRSTPCIDCPMSRVLKTKQQEDHEYTYPNGHTFHVWTFPFSDADGTDAILQLGFDITERKMIELEMAKIADTERRRIGRDLHDTLGQQLTSVGYLVAGLMRRVAKISPQDKPATDSIIAAINKAVGQVRVLARGLDPIGIEADGLAAVLRELAEGVSSMSTASCKFTCDGSVELDSSAATHLYHICQEAINNAVKHGRAENISVDLARSNGQLVLTVSDDGVGLPDNMRANTGMGLRVMKYRAGAIGAKLTIGPSSSGGTTARCMLDISSNLLHGDNSA